MRRFTENLAAKLSGISSNFYVTIIQDNLPAKYHIKFHILLSI